MNRQTEKAFVETNALLLAVHSGRCEDVRRILSAGVDVNRSDPDGLTPLMAAAMTGDVAIARLLLDAGACLDSFNKWGLTARDIALWHGCGELATFLETRDRGQGRSDDHARSVGRVDP